MSAFDYPSNVKVLDERGIVSTPWNQLFSRWQSVISAIPQSGPTASRPTSGLWIGRQFWDTTLQRPVYVKSVLPTVWADVSGSATPAGSTTQVQYNNAGAFGASSNFTYDSTTNTLTVGNITGSALGMTIQPKAPTVLEDAGQLILSGRSAVKANSNGGAVRVASGNGLGTGVPGTVTIAAGTSGVLFSLDASTALMNLPLNASFSSSGGGFTFQGTTVGGGGDIFFNAPLNAGLTGCNPIRFGTDSGNVLEVGEPVFGSQSIGFFGVTPAVRAAVYTQTFSTASRTVSNPTFTNVSTTAATNITPWGFSTQAQADALATKINQLAADVAILRQLINSLIDDQQAYGLAQ